MIVGFPPPAGSLGVWPVLQRWDVDLDGSRHVVEFDAPEGDPAWVFPRDGIGLELPRFDLHRTPVVVTFDIAGHEASLTMRSVGTPAAEGHPFGTFYSWYYAASGMAPMTTYVTYELVVDGAPRGTWVAAKLGGEPGGWEFVEPGGTVPERSQGPGYVGTWQDPSRGVARPPAPLLPVTSRPTSRKDRALLLAGLAGFILLGLLVTVMVDLLSAHQVPAGR